MNFRYISTLLSGGVDIFNKILQPNSNITTARIKKKSGKNKLFYDVER